MRGLHVARVKFGGRPQSLDLLEMRNTSRVGTSRADVETASVQGGRLPSHDDTRLDTGIGEDFTSPKSLLDLRTKRDLHVQLTGAIPYSIEL